MKKIFLVMILIVFAVGVLWLSGCGNGNGEEHIVVNEGGEKTEYTFEDISEEELGVPIYPGAEMKQGVGGEVTSEGAEGKSTVRSAVLVTDDSPGKVIDWYRDKLSQKPGFQDSLAGTEETDTALFSFDSDGYRKTVLIERDDVSGTTEIAVASTPAR